MAVKAHPARGGTRPEISVASRMLNSGNYRERGASRESLPGEVNWKNSRGQHRILRCWRNKIKSLRKTEMRSLCLRQIAELAGR